MTPEERTQFIADVAAAIKASEPAPILADEEQQWVRLAIQKEAQSIKLRQAVIEKTISGLVWSAVIWREGRLLFSIKYLWWMCRYGYWNNPYEVEARRAESEIP